MTEYPDAMRAASDEVVLTIRANLLRCIDEFLIHEERGTADVSVGKGSPPRQSAAQAAGWLVMWDEEAVRRGLGSLSPEGWS